MIQTDAIYRDLTSIFRDVFEEDDLVVRPELTAEDVDGWTSLANVRLMLTIEQAFGIRFSAAQTASLANVGELVALIGRKCAEK